MSKLKSLVTQHPFFSVYFLVYFLIQIGLMATSGFTFALPLFIVFFIPLLLCYFLFPSYNIRLGFPQLRFSFFVEIVLLICLFGIVIHFFLLGKIPLLEAWETQKISLSAMVRKDVTLETPKLMLYLSSLITHALLPYVLIISFIEGKRWVFICAFLIGSFYSIALIQKSLILFMCIPLLAYFFLQKKWLLSGLICLWTGTMFLLTLYASNPQLRGGTNDFEKVPIDNSNSQRISEGILRRVLITPGKTASMWFEHVPCDLPFLYGSDVRLFALLTQRVPHDYSTELYPLCYPDYHQKGLRGSVNAAHFMRSYVSFGWWGLFVYGIVFALFLRFLNRLLKIGLPLATFSLLLFPMLLLSSGSLMTSLFSGGMGLSILFLLCYKPVPYAAKN